MTYVPEMTPQQYSSAYLWNELNKLRNQLDILTKASGLTTNQDFVWDDYVTSGLAVAVGASAPTLTTFLGNFRYYVFPGTGPAKDVQSSVHILHGIKPGTDIHLHIHWAHIEATATASAASKMVWQAEWSIARGYGAGVFGNPSSPSTSCGTLSVTSSCAVAAYTHNITDDDAMVIPYSAELEVDSVLMLRIFRDGSHPGDLFSGGCYLLQIDCHYQKDRLGTIERNRPFGSWR